MGEPAATCAQAVAADEEEPPTAASPDANAVAALVMMVCGSVSRRISSDGHAPATYAITPERVTVLPTPLGSPPVPGLPLPAPGEAPDPAAPSDPGAVAPGAPAAPSDPVAAPGAVLPDPDPVSAAPTGEAEPDGSPASVLDHPLLDAVPPELLWSVLGAIAEGEVGDNRAAELPHAPVDAATIARAT